MRIIYPPCTYPSHMLVCLDPMAASMSGVYPNTRFTAEDCGRHRRPALGTSLGRQGWQRSCYCGPSEVGRPCWYDFSLRESHQDIQVLGPLPYSGFSMRGFREKANRTASIKLRRCAAGAKMHHFRSVKIDEYCLCTFLVLWMNLRDLFDPTR